MNVSSDKKIIEIINKLGPEHLEISIKKYKPLVSKIKNAGSVCLGKYGVMAMTDYGVPGTNHVLPTNSTSKYSSGLNVSEFMKRISFITLSKKVIDKLGPSAITLANYEGLAGHAQSIKKSSIIKTTNDLADAIKKSTPPNQRNKTLARVFQAIRIAVNGEIEKLKTFLEGNNA